jgi:hypothetical protein
MCYSVDHKHMLWYWYLINRSLINRLVSSATRYSINHQSLPSYYIGIVRYTLQRSSRHVLQ